MNPNALAKPLSNCAPSHREWLTVANLDFPRGALTEIVGPVTSGRTTLACSLLAAATGRGETCAYVDTSHCFDPVTGSEAGIVLSNLLWIRGNHNTDYGLRAADALTHAGGFGVIVLDLGHVASHTCRRIPLSYWYRFRRAVENTPTIFTLIEREPMAKSCAILLVDMACRRASWAGSPGFELLRAAEICATPRRPMHAAASTLLAGAIPQTA